MKNLGLNMGEGSKGKKVSSGGGLSLNLKQECVYQYKLEQPPLLQIEPSIANRSREAAAVNLFLDGSSNLERSDTKSVAINC